MEQWMLDLKNSVTRGETIAEDFSASVEDINEVRKVYPMRIPRYYYGLIEKEGDPVWMQSVPSIQEIQDEDSPEDPLHEDEDSPVPRLTHRYPDRVLFLVTDRCPMYCRFCTRKRMVGRAGDITEKTIAAGIEYIRAHPEIRDVLLSGGDPLMLSDQKLESIISRLKAIPHIEVIRIGTKFPCVLPSRITDNLCGMLRKYHPLYLNTHFNHPKEITPESTRACEMLADAGIPLGNQSVLMKDINDCAKIMKRLVHGLVKIRVKPYYYYQCDLAEGTRHFRTSVAKGIEIYESLRGHTTGFAVPTYIIDAIGGGGKTPVIPTYLISQANHQVVLRNYEGIISQYTEPVDYISDCHCEDCEAERDRTGVAKLFDTFDPTLGDVWAERWKKVEDRKALMADIHTEPFKVVH